MYYVLAGVTLFSVLAWLLFKDTMNRIQYVERLRLYWITRNNGTDEPVVSKAFMRQTSPPYWRGRGIQFRFRSFTFQVGVLTMRVNSLESQISRLGWLPAHPKELRKWD